MRELRILLFFFTALLLGIIETKTKKTTEVCLLCHVLLSKKKKLFLSSFLNNNRKPKKKQKQTKKRFYSSHRVRSVINYVCCWRTSRDILYYRGAIGVVPPPNAAWSGRSVEFAQSHDKQFRGKSFLFPSSRNIHIRDVLFHASIVRFFANFFSSPGLPSPPQSRAETIDGISSAVPRGMRAIIVIATTVVSPPLLFSFSPRLETFRDRGTTKSSKERVVEREMEINCLVSPLDNQEIVVYLITILFNRANN